MGKELRSNRIHTRPTKARRHIKSPQPSAGSLFSSCQKPRCVLSSVTHEAVKTVGQVVGRLSDWSIDGVQSIFRTRFLFCLEIVYLLSGIYCNPSRCLSRSSGDKSFSYAPIGLARIAPLFNTNRVKYRLTVHMGESTH